MTVLTHLRFRTHYLNCLQPLNVVIIVSTVHRTDFKIHELFTDLLVVSQLVQWKLWLRLSDFQSTLLSPTPIPHPTLLFLPLLNTWCWGVAQETEHLPSIQKTLSWIPSAPTPVHKKCWDWDFSESSAVVQLTGQGYVFHKFEIGNQHCQWCLALGSKVGFCAANLSPPVISQGS